MNLRIKQTTLREAGKNDETVFEANGCAIVYAVYDRDYAFNNRCSGFVVKSFVAKDNGKVVATASNWADLKRAARRYIKANAQRHFDFHAI